MFLLIGGVCEAGELHGNIHRNRNGESKNWESSIGKASWYSSKDACGKKTNNLKGCPTASGKSIYALEREKVLFCAVPKGTHRLGSRLKITNSANGKYVVVTVLDTGGFKKYSRSIDLGKEAFSKLAPVECGIINVKIQEIK